MAAQKLFSSDLKSQLAAHTANYAHNRDRAKRLTVYAQQAAEYAWHICDIFNRVLEHAETVADLNDICNRIESSLGEVVKLESNGFEEKKTELSSWIKKRRLKESSTAKRLRKID